MGVTTTLFVQETEICNTKKMKPRRNESVRKSTLKLLPLCQVNQGAHNMYRVPRLLSPLIIATRVQPRYTTQTTIYLNIFERLLFPFIVFTHLVSLRFSRSSDPGSHTRPPPPFPTKVRVLNFHREKRSALSFHVDWHRIVTIYKSAFISCLLC